MPPVSDMGFGKQPLANSMNASTAAYATSDLLSVRFLKSLAFLIRPDSMAAAGDIPVAGVSGLYHTFDYSGKI
jgi:hypothetical protein